MAHSSCHIMAFGAHAADVEFSCGAVIAKHTKHGHRATIVYLTLGEAGHPGKSPQEYAEQKRIESQQAAKVLNAQARYLPYRDGQLPASSEAELAICDLIRELKPDIVLTHWRGSLHQDHAVAYHLVLRGVAIASLKKLKRDFPPHRVESVYFPENWEDPQNFVPEVYIDVTETFDIWLEAASKYALFRGEVVDFPYQEYYKALASIRGAESRCRYAVAFMKPRQFGISCLELLPHKTPEFTVEPTRLIGSGIHPDLIAVRDK